MHPPMNERFPLMLPPFSGSGPAMAGSEDMAPDLQHPGKQYKGSAGPRPLAGKKNR